MSDAERRLLFHQHNGPYTDAEIMPVIAETFRSTRGAGKFRGLHMGSAALPALAPGDTLLVNLDSAGGPGTHWGVLRRSIENPKKVIWIDSLGLMPPRPITHSARKQGLSIVANDGAEQDIAAAQDALCGPRAALFIKRLVAEPKKDFQAFLDLARD